MFPKLLAIILVAGLIAASLLVVRQRRLDLAHEASRLHRRVRDLEPRIWDLEAEVARCCRPEAVKVAVDRLELDGWMPIPDRAPLPTQVDFALAGGASGTPRGRSPFEG